MNMMKAESTSTSSTSTSSNEDCFRRLGALGLEPRDREHHKPLKRASVLVLLFVQNDKLHTLITKRSEDLRSHPGECCFPGGRQDEQDENDDVRTALREAQEEIGLDPKHVEILSRFPSIESVHHLCVTPIIAMVKESSSSSSSATVQHFMRDYKWKINHHEVDHAFGVPLEFFLQDPVSIYPVEWSGETFYMRTYEYHDDGGGASNKTFTIWGLTAHIAHQVASIAFDTVAATSTGENVAKRTRASTKKRDKSDEVKDNEILSGYLWKREFSSRGRPYWTKRYFVRTKDDVDATAGSAEFLHQYDSEQHAHRKSQTATKKNRLPLKDCQVTSSTSSSPSVGDSPPNAMDGEAKYEFVLSALGGRIQWHLAAPTSEDRDWWINALVSKTKSHEEQSD